MFEGRVRAGKVDCDREQQLCSEAAVRGYPTVYYYDGATSPGARQVSARLPHCLQLRRRHVAGSQTGECAAIPLSTTVFTDNWTL